MPGFSWIANVHSPGPTEYNFSLTKDGKLNNSDRSLNESSLLATGIDTTPAGTAIVKAAPKTVTTAANGMATGLVVSLTGASDQLFINPTNDTTKTTASNLTITCNSTQCMVRKPTTGGYERYGSVNSLSSGTSLSDGTQVLVEMPSASAAAMGLNGAGKYTGAVTMGSTGTIKLYVPSYTQLKVDGTVVSSGVSYSSATKLLTISSLSAGVHQLEISL